MSRVSQFIPPTPHFIASHFAAAPLGDMVCYLTNTPAPSQRARPMNTWSDSAPIYRQLADRLATQLLDGDPPEGEAMPSVRQLASRYLINPLTVSRALQSLADEGLVEPRRGLGMYVRSGARQRLRQSERDQFLHDEWPRLAERLRRLGIGPDDLDWEAGR